MTGRQLLVRAKSTRNAQTAFVRLSQDTVDDLINVALSGHASSKPDDADWNLSADDGTDFLPLEIAFPGGIKTYASFNGGVIDDQDTIEVPPWMLPKGFTANRVTVRPLLQLKDARSIEIIPLSVEDWEQIEVHAAWLENGGLLNQVSVVYPAQVLTLGIDTMDTVRVKVVADWKEPCRRLVARSELCIKSIQRGGKLQMSPPVQLMITRGDLSHEMLNLADRENIRLPVVPLRTALINPRLLELVSPGSESTETLFATVWRDDRSKTLDVQDILVLGLETSEEVPEDRIALHVLDRTQIGASPFCHQLRFRVLQKTEVDRKVAQTKRLLESRSLKVRTESITVVVEPDALSNPWSSPTIASSMALPHGLSDLSAPSTTCILSSGALVQSRSVSKAILLKVHIEYREGGEPVVNMNESDVARSFLPFLVDKIPSEGPCEQIKNVVSPGRALNWLPTSSDIQLAKSQSDWEHLFRTSDGVIVQGEIGSGRTHQALVLAAILRLSGFGAPVYLDCKRLQSSPDLRMKNILEALTDLFRKALELKKSVIVLDDIDELIPSFQTLDGKDESTQQTQINPASIDQAKLLSDHLHWLIETAWPSGELYLIVTCRSRSMISPTALSAQLLLDLFDVPTIGLPGREEMFCQMLRRKSTRDLFSDEICKGVGPLTEGFRPRDLETVAIRVAHRLEKATEADEVNEIVESCIAAFVPLARQGIELEELPQVDWDDVGGLFRAKKQLRDAILDPVRYRRIYEQVPVPLPRGVLLFGPPGCGKSFLVPALAKECGYTLVMCRGPELLDKYIGASEAKVRQLFARARSASPSFLFLDEFDALAPRRGSDHTGVTDRIVNQLLTYLDGVETDANGSDVYIIAATSRPDKIDPALLRPGRLETHVHVGYPNAETEWNDVLRKTRKGRLVDSILSELVESDGLLVDEINMGLFSPADMTAIWNTAYLNAVHEYLAAAGEEEDDGGPVIISLQNMIEAIQNTRPSLGPNDRSELERIYRPFLGLKECSSDNRYQQLGKLKTTLR